MRLKKLELLGFKSFAQKAVFEFEPGLTALVGPNGVGKSNVVDAIKWVLGEQSAQSLRGTEMADVIFKGSESHQPLGYAEVILTIDNASGMLAVDYDEVSIKRRVYRSGEGEYFINNHQCRLKDVRALLMDTGIGVGCYSIIEQGRVDTLLRAGARERRAVFEEAAGINRYLDHKREAERKLERVKLNLERLGDIVEEVRRQLRSVKYQAAKARKYKQYSERLEQLRLARSLNAYRDLMRQKAAADERLEELQQSRRAMAGQCEQAAAHLAMAQEKLETLRGELAGTEERIAHIEARLFSLAREVELNTQRIAELDAEKKDLSARADRIRTSAAKLEEELKGTRGSLAECAAKLQHTNGLVRSKQALLRECELERQRVEQRMEKQKGAVFRFMQQESHMENQMAMLTSEKRTLGSRLARLEQQSETLRQSVSEMEGEISAQDRKLRGVLCHLEGVRSSLVELDGQIGKATAELEELASQKAQAQAELSGKFSRKQLLEDLRARGEGIEHGAKFLLEAARGGRLEGCIGLVADLVSVESRYAQAVEGALGHRAQAVAFRTARQAAKALDMLKSADAGKAEVIPLDRLATGVSPALPEGPGVIAPLAQFVQLPPELEPAAEFFLGGCVLVRDTESALSLLENGLPAGVRLVTPAGECFQVGGVWVGGRPEKGGILSRKSELNELNKDLPALRQRIEQLADRKNKCVRRMEQLRAQKSALAEEKERLTREENDIRGQLRILASRKRELQEEIELNQAEQKVVAADIQEADRRALKLGEQVKDVQAQRREAEIQVADLQQHLSEANEQSQALSSELSTLAREEARLQEQHNSLESLARRVEEEAGRARRELDHVEAQQATCTARRSEAEEAIESARAETVSLEREKTKRQEDIKAKSAHRGILQDEIDRLNGHCRKLSAQQHELDDRLQQCRLDANETRLKIENLTERLRDDYGVNLNALELEPQQWRATPLFSDRTISDFQAEESRQALEGEEIVARWFVQDAQQSAADADSSPEEQDRSITLREAVEYRDAILALANDPSADWEALKREEDQLKKKVDRMGSVNLEAIRQQDELEIREQYLSDQIEDLERARRHEQEIIRELNKKSRESLQQTFTLVRQNFQEMFRKLFGGGTADLVLEGEDEDILEAGIEIVARPPGKETRIINLLSGGEKVLTTLALLFAIFKAKPSPFCLLDEVDAALDETNIGKFVGLLNDFLRNTQFIIITHNKMTMSVADALYGISSEEPGVSKKISVRFEDVDRQLGQTSGDTKAAPATAKAG